MKSEFLTFVVLYLTTYLQHTRSSLLELCEQIDYYSTSSESIHCLDYDEYGCWCGPGGSGTPVDATDACCRTHDHCYDKIIKRRRCNPYLAHYHFSNGRCLDEEGSCLNNLCKCDQVIAQCLSKTKYHFRYYGWRIFHRCK